MNRYLVIARVGDRSLHRGWMGPGRRNFDLFLSYYGATPGQFDEDAQYYERRMGTKWGGLSELLEEHWSTVSRYDAVWMPDDDIEMTAPMVSRMFELFMGVGLNLAQPALTPDSYSYWDVVRQRPGSVVRFTRFVEVMMPLFDQATLAFLRPGFSESPSGWGLDYVWPHLLAPRGNPLAMGILDAVPARHTRPLGGGELYKSQAIGNPAEQLARLLAKHGLREIREVNELSEVARLALCRPTIGQRLRRALALSLARKRYRRRSDGV